MRVNPVTFNVKNLDEVIDVNPDILTLFKKTDNGKYILNIDDHFKYDYNTARAGDQVYMWDVEKKIWKKITFTYKRSGVIFFKTDTAKKEDFALGGADPFWKYSLAPIFVVCNSDRWKIVGACSKTLVKSAE